ncbi:hypothetical protein HJC23_012188 [Cyclotella cryptica]|uniref:SET domain-containing protein n=1 Tax=Cyclotella cryptica TaxID=29204 RepID=A0ABD3PUN9_9STRA
MKLPGMIATLFLIATVVRASGDPEIFIANLIEWLRANGAYINENVAVKRSIEGDLSSPLGLVAIADINAEETICYIPPHLIIQPGEDSTKDSDCSTIQETFEMLNAKEPNPYAQYLLSQLPRYTPEFWSEAGRSLLKEMLHDFLPPVYIDATLNELKSYCNGDIDNPMYLHAAMLVKSRADYNYLVPFYDMTNHHNRKLNMKHVFDPYKEKINETGYAIATARAIKSGEQLYISYNRCNICTDYYDWFGTAEIFLSFGFVEQYPQRWLFDLSRIKFDLDIDNTTGSEVVTFLVPPSKKGIDMLRRELERLDTFSEHRTMNTGVIPDNEWSLLWDYYDALHNALSRAVESDAPRSDDVWSLGDDWWVRDGTMHGSSVEEHFVRRSQLDDDNEL